MNHAPFTASKTTRVRTTAQALAAGLLILATTGCSLLGTTRDMLPGDQDDAQPTVAPGSEVDFSGNYTPLSNTAMAFTGPIEIDADGLTAAKGLAYDLGPAKTVHGGDPYPASGSEARFADVLLVAPETPITLRRAGAERIRSSAPNGGLCGKHDTAYIALAQSGTSHQTTLQLAAFSRDPLTHGEGPALCGTFYYFKGAGPETAPKPAG